MPSIKNNQGFGYLPILAISALVLTGTYFGYSWYSSNSNQEVENKLSAVVEEDNSDKDVLQRDVIAGKIPANYNPDNLPFAWIFSDQTVKEKTTWYMFYTGRDIKKLEAAMQKLKDKNFISIKRTSKPCIDNGFPLVINEYPNDVKKLQEDFYLVTVTVNNFTGSDLDKKCGVSRAKEENIRGLNYNEAIFAPNGFKTPLPASLMYSSGMGQTTSPSSRTLQGRPNQTQTATPKFDLPVDVTKMKLIRN